MRIWILVVVVIVAVGAGLYYFLVDPYMSRVLQLKLNEVVHAGSIPEELSDATYLLSPQNGGGIYTHGELLYPDYVETGSIVVDIAQASDIEAKLRFEPQSREYELVIQGEPVFSHSQALAHLALSPSGNRASVALTEGMGESLVPEDWTLRVIDMSTAESFELVGFAGLFVDEDTLLVFRSSGIYAVTLSSMEEVVIDESPITARHISISFDRASNRIAWMTPFGEIVVRELNTESSLQMFPLARFAGTTGTLALKGEDLYVLAPKKGGGTHILHRSIFSTEEPVVLRDLPTILGMAKLIP